MRFRKAIEIQRRSAIPFSGLENIDSSQCHEAQFYSADSVLLESFARFIATALKANHPAIVILTQSHREGLVKKLIAQGFDVNAFMQRGTYIALDAARMLSTIMTNGAPDRVRFFDGLCDLIEAAAKAADGKHTRVALCGECVGLLCAEGKINAALQLEETGNDVIELYDVDIFCAYPLSGLGNGEDDLFERICELHTAVHSE